MKAMSSKDAFFRFLSLFKQTWSQSYPCGTEKAQTWSENHQNVAACTFPRNDKDDGCDQKWRR